MARKLLSILVLLLFLQLPSFCQEIPLTFEAAKNMPYFESPETTIDSAEYDTLILRVKAKQKGTARFFWASSYNMQFNQPKSIWFSIKSGEHNYYINVPSQNPYWIGWIKKFIVYPETQLEIRSAKIIRGNLFTHLASGWQEFWGPKGRVEIGSTVHVIPSSSIFGKSINYYIYWITGLYFILVFAVKSVSKINKSKNYFKTLSLPLMESARQTCILTILFWLLLTLNSDYNFFHLFKENYSKYHGKNIEQKRIAAYEKELYDFLIFAKEKLPKEPVVFGVVTTWYASEHKARIMLFPPHVYDFPKQKNFPYLLVLYPPPDFSFDKKDYIVYAKMNDKKYILKRIN